MSTNTNFTCREKYYSYGSYLRSRGYDKEICNLVAAIEAGQIVIGPITPGKCPGDPTTINNSVNINGCPSGPNSTTGILKVTGGNSGPSLIDGSGNITSFLTNSKNFGIQSNTGIRNLGPIFSSTDCDHSNYFGAKFHIFDGGTGGDCSTNVIIRGNLLVDGSFVELGGFFGETLTLVTLPGNDALGTLNLFRSPQANGNTMTVYNDTSANIVGGLWETGLTFSIDGNLDNTTTGTGIDRIAGMTDTQGHVRSFRGITVSNPPLAGQPIDICYNRDISGSSYALQVYGDLQMNPGNNDASGNIDLSGGDINFYLNNNLNSYIHANGDASFNGHVTVFDLSVINVMTVGTATTFVDTSNVKTNNLTIRSTTNPTVNFSTFSESLTGLSITAGTNGTRNIKLIANKTIMNDASMLDVSAQNLDVSNTIKTPILNVDTIATINEAIIDTSLVTNFIRSKLNTDLEIRGGLSGNTNVVFDASRVIINDLSVNTHASINDLSVVNFAYINDLSVNDLSVGLIDVATINSSTINNSGNITTTDLSVNTHASIYDLSVVNFAYINDLSVNDLNVGLIDVATINSSTINNSGNITTTDLSVNTHASIYDLSVVNFAYINDLSVNDLNVGLIDVATINSSTINNSGNITTTDLSVNTHASIYDLSVVNFAYINDLSVNDLSVELVDVATINSSTINNSGNITTTDLSVNTHASIYDLSVTNFMTIGTSTTTIDTNSINATSGYFNDISVNDLSVNTLEVESLEIANQLVLQDLSVNTYASFNDVSINTLQVGDNTTLSELATGNFLISNKSTDGITIQTNFGTNEKITISNNQGGGPESILIKSTSGGVDISAGFASKFTTSNGKLTLQSGNNLELFAMGGNNVDISGAKIEVTGDLNVDGDISANGIISGFSFITPIIESGLGTPLTIKGGQLGKQNVVFDASRVVITDLSVNTHASIYDLSVTNFMTVGTSTTTIDTNSINATSGYFNDISVNDLSVNTLEVESLEIANQLVLQDLSVNTHASIYDLSVNNFAYINDLSVNALNTGNVSANNLYLKENLTLNGNITGTSGDLLISTFAGGDLKMTAGTPGGQFIDGDIIFERQNAKTTNKFGSTTRILTNFGETISIIDISSNKPVLGYSAGQHDLSFSSILYSNIDNSTNLFSNSCIDFSNNQSIVGNSIWEMYFSVPAEFGNQSESIALVLSDKNSADEIIIDTRSVGKESGFKTIVFGPQSFIFTPSSSDNIYISKQWNVSFDICGGSGPQGNIKTQNGRLTMKQKSLI